MFSTRHELCRLKHVYAQVGLELISSCSLKLSFDACRLTSPSKSDNLLETFTAAGVWITSGIRLPLHIRLRVDGSDISQHDGIGLAETLGVVLRDLEIWKTLNLTTTLEILPQFKEIDRTVLHMTLFLASVDPPIIDTKGGAANQYSTSRPTPPSGVPIVYLDALDLTFRTANVRKLDSASESAETSSILPYQYNMSRHSVARDSGYQREIVELFDPESDSQSLRHQGVYEDILEIYEITNKECCEPMLDNALSSQDSVQLSASPQNGLSSQSSYPSTTSQTANVPRTVKAEGSELEHIAKLLDAAIRTTIGGGATPRTSGIRLSSRSGRATLAEVAPALFSPDYSVMISQRSSLLPTISYGLAAIYERTRSLSLKSKIDELKQLSLDERLMLIRDDPDFGTSGRSPSTLSTIFKLRFWQLAQARIFDAQSTRKLKPSQLSETSFSRDTASEAMLDEIGFPDFHDKVESSTGGNFQNILVETVDVAATKEELPNQEVGLFLEPEEDDDGDMLDLNESFGYADDMLNFASLKPDWSCDEDDKFPWEDEILDEDEEGYEDMLSWNATELDRCDERIDLFREAQSV